MINEFFCCSRLLESAVVNNPSIVEFIELNEMTTHFAHRISNEIPLDLFGLQ